MKTPKKNAIESIIKELSITCSHIRQVEIHNQIASYLDRNFLLDPLQPGFRTHCGTTTVLEKIVDDLKLSITAKQFPVLVLLDFSKLVIQLIIIFYCPN